MADEDPRGAVSVARGLGVLAVLASLAVGVALLWPRPQRAPLAAPVCAAPVEIEDDTGLRVGCASDADLGACGDLLAGDRARFAAADCHVERGGMSAEARLVCGLKLNANRASAHDLELLDGIGPHLAAAMVTAREEQGGFHSVADLGRVPGIGPALLGKLEAQVMVGSE